MTQYVLYNHVSPLTIISQEPPSVPGYALPMSCRLFAVSPGFIERLHLTFMLFLGKLKHKQTLGGASAGILERGTANDNNLNSL